MTEQISILLLFVFSSVTEIILLYEFLVDADVEIINIVIAAGNIIGLVIQRFSRFALSCPHASSCFVTTFGSQVDIKHGSEYHSDVGDGCLSFVERPFGVKAVD